MRKIASREKRQTIAELHELQALMASAVMRPLAPSGGLRPVWKDGQSTRKLAASFIKPNDRLTSFERLQIYSRQYWFRVLDCFYEDYPGLHAVLGDAKFHRLAIAYLANHPSSSFTLRNLGRKLVAFIEDQPKWTSPRTLLALDMARLEWAHTEAFDSEAQPPLTANEILDGGPQRLRLKLQPYITLLKLNYAVDDFVIAARRSVGLRSDASNAVGRKHRVGLHAKMIRPLRKQIWLAVHRHHNRVYYKRLTAAQFALLVAIQTSGSLSRAIERFAEDFAGPMPAPEKLGQWFKDWALLGWFSR